MKAQNGRFLRLIFDDSKLKTQIEQVVFPVVCAGPQTLSDFAIPELRVYSIFWYWLRYMRFERLESEKQHVLFSFLTNLTVNLHIACLEVTEPQKYSLSYMPICIDK